jgi:hypothetical protein
MASLLAQLQEQELKIHLHVLKHVSQADVPFHQKQRDFSETCFAIRAIIKRKLYRAYSPNLEQYFLKKFKVSRAQVYRLLDCASILDVRVWINVVSDGFACHSSQVPNLQGVEAEVGRSRELQGVVVKSIGNCKD